MNCLSRVPSYTATVCRRATRLIGGRPFVKCANAAAWSGAFRNASLGSLNSEFVLCRYDVRCYSSKRGKRGGSKAASSVSKKVVDPEKDSFFVVRKGDIVGVYRSFLECQAQLGSSVCDPPVSVFKGYNISTDSENYLASLGLKDAIYTVNAADLKDDLFGTLTPCPLQEPAAYRGKDTETNGPKETSHDALEGEVLVTVPTDPFVEHVSSNLNGEEVPISLECNSCILEFDGSSKGNPGKAGAGAVLRADDGSMICILREGVGTATNNVAEYRAIILGLRYALEKGCRSIRVRGDSKLVCMQVQGLWKVRHKKMSELFQEVKRLKQNFLSFEISHVLRGLNSEADAQANKAIVLADGQVEEECVELVQMG
ncbi:RNase H domain-containing protein [Psidium guajava]|nr:RNase H domain-containing protein [Psidium guajava]